MPNEDMTEEDMDDLGAAVRDTAIEQICAGLRRLGIPEAEITKATDKAKRTNSDAPLLELARNFAAR